MPLVIDENNSIKLDRIKLFSILNKSKNTKTEQEWLNIKFKQYGVVNKDLSTLKIRMDEVPVSMAIAKLQRKLVGEHQGLLKKEMHCLVSGRGVEKE